MDIQEIAGNILQQLEKGWNNGNGTEFAEPFGEVSEFVNITGTLYPKQSRADIAAAHQDLFNGLYKDSRIVIKLLQAQQIDQNTMLVHTGTEMNSPAGPLAGRNESTITMVLIRSGDDWKIRAFHNTLVRNR